MLEAHPVPSDGTVAAPIREANLFAAQLPSRVELARENAVMKQIAVGIVLFNRVNLFDFAGPFEVLSQARVVPLGKVDAWHSRATPFQVFTVGESHRPIETDWGLRVEPSYKFDENPRIEILIVPGGPGVFPIVAQARSEQAPILKWIRSAAQHASVVTSVSTGALILAKLGWLRNRSATTHFRNFECLRELDSTTNVLQTHRIVDDGRVITSAGGTAGLELAFHIVEKYVGTDAAEATAEFLEYPRIQNRMGI